MEDEIQTWLRSGEYALLDGIALAPRSAGPLPTAPLVNESEEGFAYFLIDRTGRGWVLKKFVAGQEPHPAYVDGIQTLVPKRQGFESGFDRKILRSSSVSRTAFWNREFQAWIDGTVLMPQVLSPAWSEFADSIRDGSKALSTVERLLLCRNLSEMVGCLESAGVAHRDLSTNNVLIDPANMELHFIDWDNLYHAALTMQSQATFGTNGYIAPFVRSGMENLHLTWREKSDRFALAVLNSEFLVIKAGSLRVEDGGLLEQNDINKRFGGTLFEVREALCHTFPVAVRLFDVAFDAGGFAECPSPADWIRSANMCLRTL